MELHFQAISELQPGAKWKKLFDTHWKAYKGWYISKGIGSLPDEKTAIAQLKRYMPEMLPIFEQLCGLAGDDPLKIRFLSGYKPPAYITGCSQAAWNQGSPQLVRNYDYHPHLSEGTLLHSAWNGRQVIAVGDSLCGAVDGMNEDGLAVSLTFGGRKVVGKGFGIPYILRYVLEFCATVDDAVEALRSIPSHMAYNVTVIDRSGKFKTIQLAPDHSPVVTDVPLATNHQGEIDWPEHAQFSQTLERASFIESLLNKDKQNAEAVATAFLKAPLYKTRFNEGFGTVYTAVYHPKEGQMELRWPDQVWKQSFADFKEGIKEIQYAEKVAVPEPAYADTDAWTEYTKEWSGGSVDWSQIVAKSIIDALGFAGYAETEKLLNVFHSETKKRGQIPWEMLADVWSNLGGSYQPAEAEKEVESE